VPRTHCACPKRPADLSCAAVHVDAGRCDDSTTAIVSQMAEGEITPEEAATAASVIETKRKALETEELDRRVAILEQQLAKDK
jgi:hypothetical protein